MYDIIVRNKSLITNGNVEHLHTFYDCPASMACTNQNIDKDLKMDQIWDICKITGLIQLRKVFPLDVVYQFPHNDGIGKVWETHDVEFSKFILGFSEINKVFEIGAGAGRVGKLFLSNNRDGVWTGLEPNHHYEKIVMKNFIHKREWFGDDYQIEEEIDAVIHSHVLEHMYNPLSFLNTIYGQIDIGKYHLFSVPNLSYFIERKYTNGLNFEHTLFLTEDIIDNLLIESGFKVVEKKYHNGLPCIFYACKKSKPNKVKWDSSFYEKNKKIFLEFVDYHKRDVDSINYKIDSFDGDIFLFGAHIFSQFLIFNGLKSDRIKFILDNSKMKQDNRLYGTNFLVKSPQILKDVENSAVILKAGIYNDEIKSDIMNNINGNVKFWE